MITRLEVEGFRNLADQEFDLDADLVVVTGRNAQGKSAVLEAAYLLATTRSFRTREPRDAIRHTEALLAVRGRLRVAQTEGPVLRIALGVGRGVRRLSVGEYAASLMDYLSFQPALVMVGESVRAISGSPGERRRFMDRATAAAEPTHLVDLGRYQKALRERNRLLREGGADRMLEPFEILLAETGERLIERRRRQIGAWQDSVGSWPDLFPEGGAARLVYREAAVGVEGQPDGSPPSPAPLKERYAAARAIERRQRLTLVGPHRDDMSIDVEGRDLLRFGSAGQIRAALAALTLAQARQVRQARPHQDLLLILDDVDSDLDAARCRALLEGSRRLGQVLAATSKPELVAGVDARSIEMNRGSVRHDPRRPLA